MSSLTQIATIIILWIVRENLVEAAMYIERSEATEAVLREATAWALVMPRGHLVYEATWNFHPDNVYVLLALFSHEGPGKTLLQKFGLTPELIDHNWFRFFDSPSYRVADYARGLPKARKQATKTDIFVSQFAAEDEAAHTGSTTVEPFHLVLGLAKQRIGKTLFPENFYEVLSRVFTPSGEVDSVAVEATLRETRAQLKKLTGEDQPLAREQARLERRLERYTKEAEATLERIVAKRKPLVDARRRESSRVSILKQVKASPV